MKNYSFLVISLIIFGNVFALQGNARTIDKIMLYDKSDSFISQFAKNIKHSLGVKSLEDGLRKLENLGKKYDLISLEGHGSCGIQEINSGFSIPFLDKNNTRIISDQNIDEIRPLFRKLASFLKMPQKNFDPHPVLMLGGCRVAPSDPNVSPVLIQKISAYVLNAVVLAFTKVMTTQTLPSWDIYETYAIGSDGKILRDNILDHARMALIASEISSLDFQELVQMTKMQASKFIGEWQKK